MQSAAPKEPPMDKNDIPCPECGWAGFHRLGCAKPPKESPAMDKPAEGKKEKPTIAELEAMLKDGKNPELMPDGSVVFHQPKEGLESYAPGLKKIILHVNEMTGEVHVDGKPCIGHEDHECECARKLFEISYASIVKPLREKAASLEGALAISMNQTQGLLTEISDLERAKDEMRKDRDAWKMEAEDPRAVLRHHVEERNKARKDAERLASMLIAADQVMPFNAIYLPTGNSLNHEIKEALAAHEALKGKT